MPVTVSIQKGDGFLRVIYEGEEDLKSEMEVAAALVEAIEKHDCRRILHDCRRVSGPRLGTTDCFTAAASYDRRFLCVRSALLDHREHVRENRFWETTVRNQGFATKLFDDEEKAIVWLLDNGGQR